jgi:hypothetical protein
MSGHIDPSGAPTTSAYRAFDELPLDTLEEAAGELLRRIHLAARDIGEGRADEIDPGSTAPRRSPRQRIAALAVLTELAAQTLAAAAAGSEPPSGRVDRHPAAVAAMMYAAPTLGGLLGRLEQDRRMLASAARGLEHRLHEPAGGAWPGESLRTVLSDVAIAAPAECAQALEAQLARWDEEERARFEAEREAGL